MEDANLVMVLVAAIAAMIVGALWYMVLFQKPWAKEMGMNIEHMQNDKKKGMGKSLLVDFVTRLFAAYVFAHIVTAIGGNPFEGAFWIWLGFFVPALVAQVVWEGKSMKLYAINVSHWLAVLLAMALVFSFF